MEANLKRVEKLVHATNSTLAQMKFSLMFDDINGSVKEKTRRTEGLDPVLLEKIFDGDDLKQCQAEFKSEASKMLAKMEKMFDLNKLPRKNSKALDRIKEINRKMNSFSHEQTKPGETEQSRQKLLSLISEEKFSPGGISSKESIGSKHAVPFSREKKALEKPHPTLQKTDSLVTVAKSPVKTKTELKSKILETEEIVDRGFQTARQLCQKVESMAKCERKEKTPSTDKTVSEINLKSLEGKTESNETISCVKCKRHSGKQKIKEKSFREIGQVNAQVVDIKRKESQKCIKSNLQLQRLPSLNLKGGLKVQKIHNLEIPATEDAICEKSNIAVNFFSHEQTKKEKIEEIIEKVKKENGHYIESKDQRNYVECFNCGKLIKIQKTWVDPRKIDEILMKCNFNVFDPRIDEFVEKLGTVDIKNWKEENQPLDAVRSPVLMSPEPQVVPKGIKEKKQNNEDQLKKDRRVTLKDFSDQLFKKYKQEVDSLEHNHLKLDSILQNLFRKVDESREVFEDCHLLKNHKLETKRVPKLTMTKPVLVTMPGSSFRLKKNQRKSGKKDLKYKNKSGTDLLEVKEVWKEKPFVVLSPTKSPETGDSGRKPLSFGHAKRSGNAKSKPKEKMRRRLSAAQSTTIKNLEVSKEEEEKGPSMSAISNNKSSAEIPSKVNFKGQVAEKTIGATSVQEKNTKLPDWILRQDESQKRLLVSPSANKSKITNSPEIREEVLEEKTSSLTSIVSSCREYKIDNSFASSSVPSSILKALHIKEEAEKKAFISSLKKSPSAASKEKAVASETLSEKSENNYESDFESITNDPEEKGGESEEPEVISCVKKLSTISEVNSELEQRTPKSKENNEVDVPCHSFDASTRDIRQQPKSNVELLKPEEGDSAVSEISNKSKKEEVTPSKTTEASLKSTPTELVTSLKDILKALQTQFARTESLAEKLTENAKTEKPQGNAMLNSWKLPTGTELVENLQSLRKDWSCSPKSCLPLIATEELASGRSEKSEDLSGVSLSDEGGSSLGEIIVSDRKRKNSEKSESSSISESNFINLSSAKRSSRDSSGRKEVNSFSGL